MVAGFTAAWKKLLEKVTILLGLVFGFACGMFV